LNFYLPLNNQLIVISSNANVKIILIILVLYILMHVYVTKRISKAYYVEDKMKRFHRKFIWMLPFLGPLVIKNFWKTPKEKGLQINTKTQRDKNTTYGGFYESGLGE